MSGRPDPAIPHDRNSRRVLIAAPGDRDMPVIKTLDTGDFNLPQVEHKIAEVEQVIRQFELADEAHRRAFALLITIKKTQSRI